MYVCKQNLLVAVFLSFRDSIVDFISFLLKHTRPLGGDVFHTDKSHKKKCSAVQGRRKISNIVWALIEWDSKYWVGTTTNLLCTICSKYWVDMLDCAPCFYGPAINSLTGPVFEVLNKSYPPNLLQKKSESLFMS